VSEIETRLQTLVPEWLHLPDLAELFGVPVTRVRQYLKDRAMIAVRLEEGGPLLIPAEFVQDGHSVKGLEGTITLLTDFGLTDAEILEWMFTPEEVIGGRPIDGLREDRKKVVRRQALNFM
jgi:hypothetical protein